MSDVWHDSFICVIWLVHVWYLLQRKLRSDVYRWRRLIFDVTSFLWHDSFKYVLFMTCLMHIFIGIRMPIYKWHDPLIYDTLLPRKSRSVVYLRWRHGCSLWRRSCPRRFPPPCRALLGTNKNESSHVYEWVMCHTHIHGRVMSHMWMSHLTYMNGLCHTLTCMNESCHTYERVMSNIEAGMSNVSPR